MNSEIEEIAKIISKRMLTDDAETIAKIIYNKGYRKVEGEVDE